MYGRFMAKRPSSSNVTTAKKVPTVLVYGHYDVIAAENDQQQWKTDPFRLTGRNGYLYGRGTSDNKVSKEITDIQRDLLTYEHYLKGTCSRVHICCL